MSGEMYDLLGVRRTATAKQIRDAYRRKAKKAHPDAGGSAEAFARLKRAYDILSDADRRAKYDATGDESEKQPDNTRVAVITVLAQALDKVLGKIQQSYRDSDPTEFDLVNDMKILLGGEKDTAERRIAEIRSAIAKGERLLGKFGVKGEGPNYFEMIIQSRVSGLQQNLRQSEDALRPLAEALAVLGDTTFQYAGSGKAQGYGYGAGASSWRLQDLMNAAAYR